MEICDFKKVVCVWLGMFDMVEDVVMVYDIVVIKFRGLRVKLNFFDGKILSICFVFVIIIFFIFVFNFVFVLNFLL